MRWKRAVTFASAALLAAIEKTTDTRALGALAEGLKAVPGGVDVATLLNLAKFPNCVDDLRAVDVQPDLILTGVLQSGRRWR